MTAAAAPAPASPPPGLRTPPFVRGHWLLGSAREVAADPLAALTALASHGDVVRFRMGYFRAFLLNHPEHVRRVFTENRIYGKQTLTYARMKSLVGTGMLTSDGDTWLRQRRIAQPAFHRERIQGFAQVMARVAEAAALRLRPAAARGEPVDVAVEMTRVTMAVVCEALLGGDVGDDADAVGHAFTIINRLLHARMTKLAPLPLWVPTGANRSMRAALATLDAIVYRIIARRRADNRQAGDLLSLFMHARDEETGEGMSDLQLRDEVITVLVAGYETTAVALAWCLYLLSQNPDAERALRVELDGVLGGRAPALADLEKLRYTRMVIDETMRLYPPVWAVARSVAEDDDLDGYRIDKGSIVLVSPWVVHRAAALWEQPEAFRPERFAPDRIAAMPRYAYFPFIGGPRQCIGNNFAIMEAQIVLATLLTHYRFALVPGLPVEPQPLLTLRPRDGVKMILSPARPD